MSRARTTICCRCFARIAVTTAAWLVAGSFGASATAQGIPDTVQWSTTLDTPPVGGAVLAGSVFVVPLQDKTLSARRLRDGSALWTLEATPTRPLAADSDRVYVASGDAIHAVSVAHGRVTWTVAAGGPVTAPPLAHAGWVIVPAGGDVLALRAADGQIIWREAVGPVEFRPAIDGDLLVISIEDGHVVAFDLPTGARRWTRALGGRAAEPFVVGDRVYVGTAAKWFFCLYASNGRTDWSRRETVVRGRAAADERHIYYAGMDNMLRAVDRRNGALRWQTGLPYRPLAGPVVLPGGIVVPSTDVLALPVVRPADGSASGRIPFASSLTALPVFGVEESGAPFVIALLGSLKEQWTVTRVAASLVPVRPVEPLKELPGTVVPIGTGAVAPASKD